MSTKYVKFIERCLIDVILYDFWWWFLNYCSEVESAPLVFGALHHSPNIYQFNYVFNFFVEQQLRINCIFLLKLNIQRRGTYSNSSSSNLGLSNGVTDAAANKRSQYLRVTEEYCRIVAIGFLNEDLCLFLRCFA